jgi:hypothetical protein
MNREYILGEIRRAAADNGGVPLGRVRFRQETGIKPSDWEGKFWARWGDALAEAGFEPNRLNSAYDEQSLIEQYIGLLRRLGHVPVISELRLAARNEGLPNHKTFTAHLGQRATLVATVRAYCAERPGYEDVMAILGETAQIQSADLPAPRETIEGTFGCVYLVKTGRYYKVGRSNAAGRREYEIGLQMPIRATKIHEIRTDDPPGIEAYWHRRFADRRKNGEWFALTVDDVTAFRRRKFM